MPFGWWCSRRAVHVAGKTGVQTLTRCAEQESEREREKKKYRPPLSRSLTEQAFMQVTGISSARLCQQSLPHVLAVAVDPHKLDDEMDTRADFLVLDEKGKSLFSLSFVSPFLSLVLVCDPPFLPESLDPECCVTGMVGMAVPLKGGDEASLAAPELPVCTN